MTDIDPQMKYCPACEDEYIPTIEKCGVCGAVLLTGADLLAGSQVRQQSLSSRKGALTPDDDIITIFKAPMAEIKRIEDKLEAENIGIMVVGEDGNCGKGCCSPNFELRVRREDAPDAAAIINADYEQMTGIADFNSGAVAIDNGFNPMAKESTCPACGTTFSTTGMTCPECGLCFG